MPNKTTINPKNNAQNEVSRIFWHENGADCQALWRSQAGIAAPKRVQIATDTLSADSAYRLASTGTALLWRGDFQNARQLLQAIMRRLDKNAATHKTRQTHQAPLIFPEAFHRYRMGEAQRARILGMLLIPIESATHRIDLRRAPDVAQCCRAVYGETYSETDPNYVISLRELLGIIGAHQWRSQGVPIAALGENQRIYPHYGVFSPLRGEYLELVAQAPLPAALQQNSLAFDLGTGTGVLAAILAQRGILRIIATDQNERALNCARENIQRLGFSERIKVMRSELFPNDCSAEQKAALIVCNPPWLPGRASTALEQAVYDPDSRMLRGFLAGLNTHLAAQGEAWLILSDLAEHLQLRSRAELLALIAQNNLHVIGKEDIRPQHPRASDAQDPLHVARAAEVTSLWRLAIKQSG